MDNESSAQQPIHEDHIKALLAELSDPLHKRLIMAYGGESPVSSMESELSQIVVEILRRED